jgi:CubicO group peptidase (beta-lactamase class C family)
MTLSKLSQSVAIIALMGVVSACDQKPNEPSKDANQQAVDAVFAEYNTDTSPGCAVAIDQDGKIAYQAASGMGDFEQGVALTPDSVFYSASVSKQVVAMVALLLEQDGLIDLDADIHTYIPEFKDYGSEMTVRNILHHTSGIRDYFNLFDLAGRLEGMVITEEKIMTMLARQQNLNFTPGDRWAYSNSAYFLISQVTKRVSGKSLDEYAQERIFGPLGMTNSRFQHNHLRPIPNKAHGHAKQENGEWFIANSLLDVVGSGGMYSTVGDWIKWDRNFYNNVLVFDPTLGKAMIDEMQTTAILNNGEPTQYGLALSLRPYRGLKRVSHGGSLSGYRAFLQRYPDQKFTVALLCNNGSVNSQKLAHAVSDIYLAGAYTEAAPEAAEKEENEPYHLPEGVTAGDFTGDFYNDEVQNTLSVIIKGDGISIKGLFGEPELLAIGDDVFGFRRMELVFDRDDKGNIAGFTYNGPRVMRLRFQKK